MTVSTAALARSALHAEWTKLRTVRSTWLMLGGAAIVTVVLGMFAAARVGRDAAGASDAVQASLGGVLLAQVAFGVLGALAVTTEYTTGMIRTTFTAMPGRRAVLGAKAVVIGTVALLAGQAIAFASYLCGQYILLSPDLRRQPGDPGVLRAVCGGGFYLFVMAMIGLGLGVLVRHTAGALAGVGILLVEPLLARNVLPATSPLGNDVLWWAGQAIMSPAHRPGYPPSGQALVVCLAYALIVLIPAAVITGRRDA